MRAISGYLGRIDLGHGYPNNPFYVVGNMVDFQNGYGVGSYPINFDFSRSVPVANEFRSASISVAVYIRY